MFLTVILSALTALSLVLVLWQWWVARRFPLHQRLPSTPFAPAVTLLKPVKGCDPESAECFRSWFRQSYSGPVQILFGVASETDPVCPVILDVLKEFPKADAQLLICPELLGASSKVSKLVQLQRAAKHEVVVISDADVRVSEDFIAQAVQPLADDKVGLVNCFYRLANPVHVAMRWEAVAINSDFWSQVLQSRSLKPIDFAMGAVMLTRRKQLAEIGAFTSLVDYLADDYELGNRIAGLGYRIEISNVVVDCWERPMDWHAVWSRQLRWARTIRVCQPVPYFFSILSNGTLWPLLLLILKPSLLSFAVVTLCIGIRIATSLHQQKLSTGTKDHLWYDWMVPVKDLLQVGLWACSFGGKEVVWRGHRYHVEAHGHLREIQ
ncbi:MAG TPA: glycosyltransferase [Roseimicrobium sp.]|nr:glycosyltransferase [Roseimicrobium sp.]